MTQQQIHDSLEAMLANPKTKNFLTHLIRAYFPLSNVEKVFDRPTGPFKCVITGDELFSVQDLLEGTRTEEYKNDFLNHIKSMFDENVDKTSPIMKLIGERKMGVTGVNTTTFMSYSTVQEFYNWVLTKSLKDDKHIGWVLRSIKKSSIGEKGEKVEKVEDKELKEKIDKLKKQNKVATYTLGETDAFKKLREKLNK